MMCWKTSHKSFKILFLLLIIVLPIKVNAFTGSISLSCDSSGSVSIGQEIKCKVNGTVGEGFAIKSVIAPIKLSSNLTAVSFTPGNSFSGNQISNGQINVYSDSEFTGNFEIGTLVVKVNSAGSGSLKLEGVVFGDNTYARQNIGNSNEVTFNVVSTLSNLTVTNGKLSQVGGFKSDVFQYVVYIDSDATTFGLVGTPTNSSDTVTYTDESGNTLNNTNIPFTLGGNNTMLVNINVGSTTYKIFAAKQVELSNTLKTLTVGGKNVSLISGVDEYTVTLDAGVKEYTVSATLTDPNNFKISDEYGGVGTYQISNTSFIITVEPKDSSSGGSNRVYTINVKQSGSGGTPSTPGSSDVPSNPQTSDIPVFIMAVILIASFAASIYFYKRNMENYN